MRHILESIFKALQDIKALLLSERVTTAQVSDTLNKIRAISAKVGKYNP